MPWELQPQVVEAATSCVQVACGRIRFEEWRHADDGAAWIVPQRGDPASSDGPAGLWAALRAQEQRPSRPDLHAGLQCRHQRMPTPEACALSRPRSGALRRARTLRRGCSRRCGWRRYSTCRTAPSPRWTCTTTWSCRMATAKAPSLAAALAANLLCRSLPLARGGPPGPRGAPSPRVCRSAAAVALRCLPAVADAAASC